MASAISIDIKSELGSRQSQQDFARTTSIRNGAAHLLVLADGVGGAVSGEQAAKLGVDAFIEAAQRGEFDDPERSADALLEVLEQANQKIHRFVLDFPQTRGMATTIIAAVLTEKDVEWVSVGDSHLYIVSKDGLIKLNADHSLRGQALEHRSGDVADNPELAARSNELQSALAGGHIPLIDQPVDPYPLSSTDICILASDGIDTLPADEIAKLATTKGITTSISIASAVVEGVLARKAPEQDNVTVVVACNEAELAAQLAARLAARMADNQATTAAAPKSGFEHMKSTFDRPETAPTQKPLKSGLPAVRPVPTFQDTSPLESRTETKQKSNATQRSAPAQKTMALPPNPKLIAGARPVKKSKTNWSLIVPLALLTLGLAAAAGYYTQGPWQWSLGKAPPTVTTAPQNELTDKELQEWAPTEIYRLYSEFWTKPVASLRECLTLCNDTDECAFFSMGVSRKAAGFSLDCRLYKSKELKRSYRDAGTWEPRKYYVRK